MYMHFNCMYMHLQLHVHAVSLIGDRTKKSAISGVINSEMLIRDFVVAKAPHKTKLRDHWVDILAWAEIDCEADKAFFRR